MNSSNAPTDRVADSGVPRTATLVLALSEEDARYLLGRALRHDLPSLLNSADLALFFAGRDGKPLSADGLRKKLRRLGVGVAHADADGGPFVERDELLAAIRRTVRR